MPLEVKQRNRNGDGEEVVAVIDGERKGYRYEYDYTTHRPRTIVITEPCELHCFTLEQAEQLAPKLMEWLIKRKAGKRNASG